jgi:hypothetical protein
VVENFKQCYRWVYKEGFNSLVILGAWTLWNHRNRCDGVSPRLDGALGSALGESQLWAVAGPGVYPSWLPILPLPLSLVCTRSSTCCHRRGCTFIWVCAWCVLYLGSPPLFYLLNTMKHSSPAFSRKK